MMADAKHLLEFLEGGIGMLFDLGLEFLRVEFAPVSPACFRGQRAGLGGRQIPINGTPGQVKPPGGLGFGAARLDEVHHPFPQVQRISFHALKPITLCPNVYMKCYCLRRNGTCRMSKAGHSSCADIKKASRGRLALNSFRADYRFPPRPPRSGRGPRSGRSPRSPPRSG